MSQKHETLERIFAAARLAGKCKTQKEFAELIGVHPSTLSLAMKGDEKYLTDKLMRMVTQWARIEGIDGPALKSQEPARPDIVIPAATMGANLADLWEAAPPKGGYWRYNRRKTKERRTDRAEVVVRLEAEIGTFINILGGPGPEWWLPGLHRWKSARVADTMVNKYLRSWAEREGLEPFTFYAARHTFATLARQHGVEKATIDEALGHIGDYKVADIYAERNWQLAWDANRQVLDLFKWPDNNRTK